MNNSDTEFERASQLSRQFAIDAQTALHSGDISQQQYDELVGELSDMWELAIGNDIEAEMRADDDYPWGEYDGN